MFPRYFRLAHKNNTKAQEPKFTPETILNKKSGSTNRLYKNVTPDVAVHIEYEATFALSLRRVRSLIVGR